MTSASLPMIPKQHFRILCVDDSPGVLETLKIVFETGGYEVETALNGIIALNKLSSNPGRFQLIVSDLRMPGMEGCDLIEQARAHGYGGTFIVYAASPSQEAQDRLRAARVYRVIQKPARSVELIEAVREAQAGI